MLVCNNRKSIYLQMVHAYLSVFASSKINLRKWCLHNVFYGATVVATVVAKITHILQHCLLTYILTVNN